MKSALILRVFSGFEPGRVCRLFSGKNTSARRREFDNKRYTLQDESTIVNISATEDNNILVLFLLTSPVTIRKTNQIKHTTAIKVRLKNKIIPTKFTVI